VFQPCKFPDTSLPLRLQSSMGRRHRPPHHATPRALWHVRIRINPHEQRPEVLCRDSSHPEAIHQAILNPAREPLRVNGRHLWSEQFARNLFGQSLDFGGVGRYLVSFDLLFELLFITYKKNE
jgi:hypothetical protein